MSAALTGPTLTLVRLLQLASPVLPIDFYFVPWSPTHLEAHAEAKFASFRVD